MTTYENTLPRGAYRARARTLPLVAAAAGFVLFYLSNDLVTPSLASSALPLPDAPGEEVTAWFAENQLAATVTGILQVLSVGCLGAFVARLRRTAPSGQATTLHRASRLGFAAVGLMVLSSVLGWVLAAVAPEASVRTVELLRDGNFIAGGTAHVLALGLFVLLASRAPGISRPLRVLAYVAVVPAVLSLSSLVVFQGAAFILVGRLLCMAWVISAAVSVARRRSGPRW